MPSPATRSDRSSERLPAEDRVRKRRDYLRVQRSGRRVHTPHFILMVSPGQHQRLGITVTRKVAHAVGRNRVKRLVREVFRRNREAFPPTAEVVVVARQGADQLDYAAVCREVREAGPALCRLARPRTGAEQPEKVR